MPTNFPDVVVPCINTVISENFIMLSKTLLGVIVHAYNSKTLEMRQEAHKLDANLGHIGRHVLSNKKVVKAVIVDRGEEHLPLPFCPILMRLVSTLLLFLTWSNFVCKASV